MGCYKCTFSIIFRFFCSSHILIRIYCHSTECVLRWLSLLVPSQSFHSRRILLCNIRYTNECWLRARILPSWILFGNDPPVCVPNLLVALPGPLQNHLYAVGSSYLKKLSQSSYFLYFAEYQSPLNCQFFLEPPGTVICNCQLNWQSFVLWSGLSFEARHCHFWPETIHVFHG